MKKVVLIPDSFKGTISSAEICRIMAQEIQSAYPKAQIISIPVADGGEGSVDSFLSAAGGRKIPVSVKGPYFREVEAFYGILPDGSTAVIEMAAAAGLPLVGEEKCAERTTTYGVGELILHAVKNGCKKILLGLGGSATHDGGAGAAAALGVRFLNREGKAFVPVGGTLHEIVSIDCSEILPAVKNTEILTMCDIDNPLCGPHGAAAVFAPQKGADPEMVKILDENLRHLAAIIKRDLGKEIETLPGAAAAGGMGGGMAAFFDSKLQMGIETVLDIVDFDQIAKDADVVFSGEGRIDFQSLRGKVVVGVARRAKRLGVPLIAVVGDIGDGTEGVYQEGVSAIFSINRAALPFSEAKMRSKEDLALTTRELMRFLKIFGRT